MILWGATRDPRVRIQIDSQKLGTVLTILTISIPESSRQGIVGHIHAALGVITQLHVAHLRSMTL